MAGSDFSQPYNLEAERAVLGGLLKKPETWNELREVVGESSFFSQAHQEIWRACEGLRSQEKSIDLVLLNAELERMSKLAEVGGTMYIVGLTDQIGVTANLLQYADELKGLADRRQLIQAAQDMMAQACDLQQDPKVSALNARQSVDTILDAHLKKEEQDPAEFVHQWADNLAVLQSAGGATIKTPIYGLNQLTSGLHPGETTIVAARTGVGKTALGLNIVEYVLHKGFGGCGIFSLEMSRFRLLDRLCASNRLSGEKQGVKGQRFRDGNFSDQDWEMIYNFGEEVVQAPLRVWDRPTLTPTEFYVQCRLWQREIDLKLVMLDYLQLMVPDHRVSSREREISEMSRSITRTASELGIHVLLLCQLSREADKSKKPMLSHLRESGAIEQDAHNILFIVPKVASKDQAGTENGLLEVDLDLAKARNNAVGTVQALYAKEYLRFRNKVEGLNYLPQ